LLPSWISTSRRIPGWATADHLRTELVTEALQRARFIRAGVDLTGTIAHSDRGCQYSSGDYRANMRLLRMTQSMSRTANCYDNATMESFRASVKTEVFRAIPATHAHALLLIHDYIDAFYNTRRLPAVSTLPSISNPLSTSNAASCAH
jgi:transposase InsO family protein